MKSIGGTEIKTEGMSQEELAELRDGYVFNGEVVSTVVAKPDTAVEPTVVTEPTSPPSPQRKYRWIGLKYECIATSEIVCTVSAPFGNCSWYAHYPIVKSFSREEAARKAVENHFGL